MKIRIIKELFGGPAHSIKAGTELYGRIVEMDPLCKMFQCTDGEYIGREIPYKFYVEIPEDKTFAESRVIELEQENLQRLEEVKVLQRKVESLTECIENKHGKLRRLREDLSKAWATINAEREARMLMEATLERAMLDHQPVVLPKEVAEAVEFYRSYKFDNADIYQMGCEGTDGSWALSINNWLKRNGSKSSFMAALVNGYTFEPEKIVLSNELDKAIKYALDTHWYKGKPEYLLKVHRELKLNASDWHSELSALNNISTDQLEKALFGGYTVKAELTLPIAYELADMIHKWTEEPPLDDEDADCLALATRIAERTKEFYSKS